MGDNMGMMGRDPFDINVPDDFNKHKFSGRGRLFIGNLPKGHKSEDLKTLFGEYGEVSESYASGDKGFGFVNMDTHYNAEKAKENLDGKKISDGDKGIRVRFATHSAALKLKEIPACASNELLYQAFSNFGKVERAVHLVDEHGRPTGEGIIEFTRKNMAAEALRKISEGVFMLTGSPKPLYAEPMEAKDEDGLQERMIYRNQAVVQERQQPPRFADIGSFEFDYGTKWKELYMLEKRQREALEAEFETKRKQLVGEMDLVFQDYEANALRRDLEMRQKELERLMANRDKRMEAMKQMGGGFGSLGQDSGAGIGGYGSMPQGMMGMGGGGGGGYGSTSNMTGNGFGTFESIMAAGGGAGASSRRGGERFGDKAKNPEVVTLSDADESRARKRPAPQDSFVGGAAMGGPGSSSLQSTGPLGDGLRRMLEKGNKGGGKAKQPDDNLVHGVQKLFKMFHGDEANESGGGFGSPPSKMLAQGSKMSGGIGMTALQQLSMSQDHMIGGGGLNPSGQQDNNSWITNDYGALPDMSGYGGGGGALRGMGNGGGGGGRGKRRRR